MVREWIFFRAQIFYLEVSLYIYFFYSVWTSHRIKKQENRVDDEDEDENDEENEEYE